MNYIIDILAVESPVMKFSHLSAIWVALAFATACGGGSMSSGGGGGSNPTPESVVIAKNANGPFGVAMSTSFQPAEWDFQFFPLNPTATTTLGNLQPQHVRLQGISHGVPRGSEGTGSTAWDFSTLDAITQPVLSVGDHSPEFQIAKAPPFMYSGNNSSNPFLDLTFTQFAGYAQNLVEYYNTGGFVANGQTYVSPAYPT